MIKINNLKKYYDNKLILDINHLEIKQGDSVAIIGPNGSGKSTLLKIISNVIKPNQGEVLVKEKLLYMPQTPYAFDKSVLKNLLMVTKDKEKAIHVLKEMDLLDFSDKNANTLSGGELQRLSLCRLLVQDTKFLILDEPTSSADILIEEKIEEYINNYKSKLNCTLVFSSHSPKQVKKLADKVIVLDDGKIVSQGSVDEMLNCQNNIWVKKFFE